MTRLLQLEHSKRRRLALVDNSALRLLEGYDSVYSVAIAAVERGVSLSDLIASSASSEALDYDEVYRGGSEWKILPPIDHPEDPSRCLVSGTGLTHLGSAGDRQAMHREETESITDSMRMFRWGVEHGRPPTGQVGVAPEWFYKGPGSILRAHLQPLCVPGFAEDGGEEAEVAGIYVIGSDRTPYRIGMAAGNEFADHVFEKKNYLNLAGSKLMPCALGPELALDPPFSSVAGRVSIERAGRVLWSRDIRTGEAEMCHSLKNLEHHHFKFEEHRRPGDVHVHFLGAHSLSFGDGIRLADGDVVEIRFDGFGRPLRNPIAFATADETLVEATPLG